MLVSEQIKEIIKKEVKSQQSVIKVLENQEKEYGFQFTKEKEMINKSIEYYNKVLNEE